MGAYNSADMVALLLLFVLQTEGPLFEEKLLARVPGSAPPESVVFSPDGRRVMFHAGYKIHVDGEAVSDANEGVQMIFSRDGKRAAHAARYGPKATVVIDGVREELGCRCLQFSEDSLHSAYVGVKEGEEFPVIDGKRGPSYAVVDGLGLSRDGKRSGFYARQKNGKWVAVVDGKAGEEFEELGPGPVRFSPDGATVAYQAKVGMKRLLVVNGKRQPEFASTTFAFWSPDGKKLAYGATWYPELAKPKSVVIVNGQRSTEFYDTGVIVFSADGRHMAYTATDFPKTKERDEECALMVIDGVRQPVGCASARLTFSPSGSKWAYLRRVNKRVNVVLNGKSVAELSEWGVRDFLFSPDESTLALIGDNEGRWGIRVGDQRTEKWDAIAAAAFSADGRSIAYSARKGAELWRKVWTWK